MTENTDNLEKIETEAVKKEPTKINGFNIASLVLGIVSIALWCLWIISIPCSILALIFGILGIRKEGKGLAIAGITTGSISLAIWFLLFVGAFMFGIAEGLSEVDTYDTYIEEDSRVYWE